MPVSERQRRWRRIERLWGNGRSQQEIAERLGLDSARVGAEIAKMRSAGWELESRQQLDPEAMERRRQHIARRWDEGATGRELADELGLTLPALRSTLERMRRTGWDLPNRREPVERAAPRLERITELWAGGATLTQISQEMGLTTSHVASAIAELRQLTDAGPERRVDTGEAEGRRQRIAELYREGRPLREIAEEVGGSAKSVGAITSQLRVAGTDLPRRRAIRRS